MCEHKRIINKYKKAGKLKGMQLEIEEAQAKDTDDAKLERKAIREDIAEIKAFREEDSKNIARVIGMVETINARLNSGTVEDQHVGGMAKLAWKSKKIWWILGGIALVIILAGFGLGIGAAYMVEHSDQASQLIGGIK